MPRKIIVRQRRKPKSARLTGSEHPYSELYKKKLKLDKTSIELPDGETGLVTSVGTAHVVICADNRKHPMVILVDGLAKWYIDYGCSQTVAAYRDYQKIIDGLSKRHSSSEVADYYLMYEWYKRGIRQD